MMIIRRLGEVPKKHPEGKGGFMRSPFMTLWFSPRGWNEEWMTPADSKYTKGGRREREV